MGTFSTVNGWLMGAVLAALVMFGMAYNALMAILGSRAEGYSALFVAVGTLFTLLGAFYTTQFAPAPWWVVLACFVASGTPMILGDLVRAERRRHQAIQRLADDAKHALDGLK
jgi:hypothetical protein